jgi:hypothetical protein
MIQRATISALSIQAQLESLAQKHGMPHVNRARNILHPRHIRDEFHIDATIDNGKNHETNLFHEFSKAVCMAGAIPRKELFEAWAVAMYVHYHFQPHQSRRVADLACGHGLLSWALLLMDRSGTRTAICIDRTMPKSSEKLANSMLQHFPQLSGRWDFVEGDIHAIDPSSSTLLVGVHCCGTLSDAVIDLAVFAKAPLALVPCCHTRKCLTVDEKISLRSLLNANNTTLSDFIDSNRIQRLSKLGFEVCQKAIPAAFTPKNRIILAIPPREVKRGLTSFVECTDTETTSSPPIPKFFIPLADTVDAKSVVRELSGRNAADRRRRLPPPNLCLSLFLPSEDSFFREQLNSLSDSVSRNSREVDGHGKISQITTHVEHVGEAFSYPNGLYARTFRIHYQVQDQTGLLPQVTKIKAKELHEELCRRIPLVFEGVDLRQVPS